MIVELAGVIVFDTIVVVALTGNVVCAVVVISTFAVVEDTADIGAFPVIGTIVVAKFDNVVVALGDNVVVILVDNVVVAVVDNVVIAMVDNVVFTVVCNVVCAGCFPCFKTVTSPLRILSGMYSLSQSC
jgi:hypothetical protein